MLSIQAHPALWALFSIPFFYLVFKILRFGHRDKRLPPGPPTLPILGNAHQIPTQDFGKKLKEWSDKYGRVFSLKVGSGTIIVLNDRRAVHDLVDKRSAIYSDRPLDLHQDMALGYENFAIMHNDTMWRAQRKIASQNLAPRVLDERLQHIQEAEMSQLVYDLLETPDNFALHIKRTTASIAAIVIFGQRAPTADSFWCEGNYRTMESINSTLEPGSYPQVEQFPIMKYVPDRFAPWKRNAKNCYKIVTEVWKEAREKIDARRRHGDERDSLIDRLLSGSQKMDVDLTYTGFNNYMGAIQQAASDTSATMTRTAVLYLAAHPWVQEKARAELDRVCGTDRLPEWTDFKDLPYINCILKENLRTRPVAASGLPHRCSRDDWFDGMLIPKDAVIFIPIWALHMTEYENPETYNPDRFLEHPKLAMDYAGSPDYMQRDHYAYGAGRRICVGIHLAERTQWRILAKMLWAFKLEPPIDPVTEKPGKMDLNAYGTGLLQEPLPFKVRIVPRSEKHAEVVRKSFGDVREFLKKWE